jgi:hypothetical protein
VKKNRDRLYALLEKLFKEIDQESIRSEVAALKKAKPDLSRRQLADHLTKRAAVRVASVGAAAGIPGGPLGVLAMAPDIFNLVLQQSRLVLSIAFLYGRKPNVKERFREVVVTLGVATSASAGRQGMRYLINKGLEHASAAKLARKIFGRLVVKRLPAVAPIIGTVAGGTLNYLSMRAVGLAAVHYYEPKRRRAAASASSRRSSRAESRPEATR